MILLSWNQADTKALPSKHHEAVAHLLLLPQVLRKLHGSHAQGGLIPLLQDMHLQSYSQAALQQLPDLTRIRLLGFTCLEHPHLRPIQPSKVQLPQTNKIIKTKSWIKNSSAKGTHHAITRALLPTSRKFFGLSPTWSRFWSATAARTKPGQITRVPAAMFKAWKLGLRAVVALPAGQSTWHFPQPHRCLPRQGSQLHFCSAIPLCSQSWPLSPFWPPGIPRWAPCPPRPSSRQWSSACAADLEGHLAPCRGST